MKTINDLIDSTAQRAIHDDQHIRKVISQTVPANFLKQIQFCRVENRVLRVTLNNASWLSRLRFSAGQIIDELNKAGMIVESATWHVAPEKAITGERPRKLKQRDGSAKSASVLRITAESMEDDELKRALLKLAAQLQRRELSKK